MANKEINRPKIIMVEGKDEVYFFNALFRHIGITDIQIIEAGGKEKIKTELPATIKRSGFSIVKSIGIIIDADTSAENTFKSITDTLKNNKLPAPESPNNYKANQEKKVGVYMMPGQLENGLLEDLCLETVADHPAMPCLKQYMECLKATLPEKPAETSKDPKRNYHPKNPSKSRALAFLAALHEPFNSVGNAAENGYWNFDHHSLNDLKSFLNQL